MLDAYPLHGHRCLLDVGGGQGRFLRGRRAARAGPEADAVRPAGGGGAGPRAPSQPSAWASARRSSAATSRATRCPRGADIASLVRVIYDHGDERALSILRAVHRALPPGGTLLLAEPMAGAPGAPRMGDAYFGMYLLAMRGGRPRTAAELAALLRERRLRAGARTAPRRSRCRSACWCAGVSEATAGTVMT